MNAQDQSAKRWAIAIAPPLSPPSAHAMPIGVPTIARSNATATIAVGIHQNERNTLITRADYRANAG